MATRQEKIRQELVEYVRCHSGCARKEAVQWVVRSATAGHLTDGYRALRTLVATGRIRLTIDGRQGVLSLSPDIPL